MNNYPSVEAMLSSLNPADPVYCLHPRKCSESAQAFIAGFPGRVLYAVKANNDPTFVKLLYEAGIRHFDCASLAEIELVESICRDAICYFMTPVRIPGAARKAFDRHSVRHFMVDHHSALNPLLEEIRPADCVIFGRMAVHHDSAAEDLSSKFGAPPEEIPNLLAAIQECGAEPALAFNVGSGVKSPEAYRHAITVSAETLSRIPFRIRLLDIGGGFPMPYPGYEVPPLDDYFRIVRDNKSMLPLADDGELLAEPGRALAASGLSTVVRVLLRKQDRIYINDGMYGSFWELRCHGPKQYKARAFRNAARLTGEQSDFVVFGPTCDSMDQLPAKISLPADIAAGDFVEFQSMGAYSLSGRTDFNGFFSDSIVMID